MDFKSFCLVILVLASVHYAVSFRAPPVLHLDRNWYVTPDEKIGTVVVRARADTVNNNVIYGLEHSGSEPIPFRIDKLTGVVYVNDTLADKVGKRYSLWVIANDGSLDVKSEVLAVVTKTIPPNPYNHHPFKGPGHLNFPPHPNIQPVTDINNINEEIATESVRTTTTKPKTTTFDYLDSNNNNNTRTTDAVNYNETTTKPSNNQSIEGEQKLDDTNQNLDNVIYTVVPLVICLILFTSVGIFLLCKSNLRIRATAKDGKNKESDGSIVLNDTPLNDWERLRADSNTYQMWENNHLQSSQQTDTSTEIKADKWEIPRNKVKVFDMLGEGAFGLVWRATVEGVNGSKEPVTVAIKTLKATASEKDKIDLIQELNVMKQLKAHPNVVRLLGCCTDKEPTFVIMEYVSLGKLQMYLRESRTERYYGNTHGGSKHLTSKDLTHYAYQVARGMDFLSSNGIIHRDLAARNVLISDDRTCKVADFGFSRDISGTYVYERKTDGKLPIRWMAPESLFDDVFTVKSDVWSFGILIWEIVTLGSTPYGGMSPADVMNKVRSGYRLEKPEHCHRELYNIMYYCWEPEPKERPDFKECVELLEKLLTNEIDYIELERFPDHLYVNTQNVDGEKV